MKTMIQKITMASAICALAFLAPQLARADKYEIVSNQKNVSFSTSILSTENTPVDKIFARQDTAALMLDVYPNQKLSNHKYRGVWSGLTDAAIIISNISVSANEVVLTVEERFLIYTNVVYSNSFFSDFSNYGGYLGTVNCNKQAIVADQICEPPLPWTTRGNYAPYCRDEMTNRIEHCENYQGVTRTIVGYYDADGDGHATLSRVGVVKSPSGDYLDERADGEYWIMNDVVIVEYTIPRNSYLNCVYGQEDAAYHYWRAVSSLYSIHLETTPLKPWWKMPEYQ